MQFVDLKSQYAALRPAIDAAIRRVLDHGGYVMGPEVGELENRLAARTGAAHCITVASGTEALLIALMALDLGAGDEVITTPFSFAATAEAIVLAGAVPVFVDIEPDTCLIDASRIERAITPRTRALMPVSLYGQPADMDAIGALAAGHGLAVIEDAAQSFGATFHERPSTALSTFGCTSFFPSKPLGCYGDGGAVFTSDDRLAELARQIRVHGQSGRYRHERIGVGGRMDTLQCAVVLAKLDRFDWERDARRRIAARYDEALADIPGVVRLAERPGRRGVFAQYTVRIRDGERDARQSALHEAGVPTAVHYPQPLHRQPAYAKWARHACPESEAAAREVLSLPMSADLTPADQDRVADALRRAAA